MTTHLLLNWKMLGNLFGNIEKWLECFFIWSHCRRLEDHKGPSLVKKTGDNSLYSFTQKASDILQTALNNFGPAHNQNLTCILGGICFDDESYKGGKKLMAVIESVKNVVDSSLANIRCDH